VVPTSVMINWEVEFKKWAPAFKLLTYFGTAKERKLKRQGWSKPNSFHVVRLGVHCLARHPSLHQIRVA
jgi:SNF2 family DNA or RNA helicase